MKTPIKVILIIWIITGMAISVYLYRDMENVNLYQDDYAEVIENKTNNPVYFKQTILFTVTGGLIILTYGLVNRKK